MIVFRKTVKADTSYGDRGAEYRVPGVYGIFDPDTDEQLGEIRHKGDLGYMQSARWDVFALHDGHPVYLMGLLDRLRDAKDWATDHEDRIRAAARGTRRNPGDAIRLSPTQVRALQYMGKHRHGGWTVFTDYTVRSHPRKLSIHGPWGARRATFEKLASLGLISPTVERLADGTEILFTLTDKGREVLEALDARR